jgi:hypothetical protein
MDETPDCAIDETPDRELVERPDEEVSSHLERPRSEPISALSAWLYDQPGMWGRSSPVGKMRREGGAVVSTCMRGRAPAAAGHVGAQLAMRADREVLKGHQWSSMVINGHQWSSIAIKGPQGSP